MKIKDLHVKFLFIGFLLIFITGCGQKQVATQKPPLFRDYYESIIQNRGELKTEEKKKEVETPEKKPEIKKAKIEIYEIPNPIAKEIVPVKIEEAPQVVKKYKIKLPVKGKIQISVENMPVYDFLNLVFGKLLSVNYVISPDVQRVSRKITLNMTEPMKPKDFLYFVMDLMKSYQIDIKYSNGIFKVEKLIRRPQQKPKYSFNIYIGAETPALPEGTEITQIIPTYYVPTSKIFPTISLFTQGIKNLNISVLRYTDAFVVSGTVNKVRKIAGIILSLDKPYFVNKYIYFIKLEYVDVDEFVENVKNILKSMGIPVTENANEVGVIFTPIKSINGLLIVSPKKEWVNSVVYWKEQLDVLESLEAEQRIFVYKPKNRSAEDLEEILTSLLEGGISKAEKKQTKTKKEAISKTAKTKKTKQTTPKTKIAEKLATVSGEVNVVVDEGRNTLIISAYPNDYKKIKEVLDQLDEPPKQVLIEVTIAEITLKDELQFGLEWYFKHSGDAHVGEIRTLGGLGVGGAGLVYSILGRGNKFNAIFNAFAKKNLINIVSTPHIIVLDGKDASINVGTEVPVVSSETTAPDLTGGGGQPSILRNVQYRSTGVILSVKPVVLSEGILNIEISQELSEAQNNTVSNIDSPIILNRSLKTNLTIRSGDTVLLGGLISTNKSSGESKVPILGDLPYIGHLFKTNSKGLTKTELVIQITPYILNDSDELDAISKKFMESSHLLK